MSTIAEPMEVVSFGCRLNLVEGEAVRRAALAAGPLVGGPLVAGPLVAGPLVAGHGRLAIVNSCGVTGEASRQARQAVRRLKRADPDRPVFVTGCASAMDPASFQTMPEVAALVANADKTAVAAWQNLAWPDSALRGTLGDARAEPERSDPPMAPLAGVADHTRAVLAVQNGCDHACTFCAIPIGRGAARSAPLEAVVASARRLAADGFREIVLTGVDLTSYGGDLPGRPTLGRLVREILRGVPHLRRLRLSSIDCVEADDALRAAFAEEERLMPYLHMSLQSGDDMILKRMKRRHTRRDAVEVCAALRRLRPDMAFGADLIAGFPTETEAMAENTRALIADCGLAFLHVFPFSPRPGTPAARMPPVAPGLARERARRLREDGDRALRMHLRAQVGRTVPVLAERGGLGRTPDFTPVVTGGTMPGSLLPFTVTGHDGRRLHGRARQVGPPRAH